MSSVKPTLPLDVVLYQKGPYWVAHCLELDLVTSGPDLREVEEDIVRVCIAQVKYAYENDLLENLLRPPNPAISRMILEALDGNGLEVTLKTEVVDRKELSFRMFRQAA